MAWYSFLACHHFKEHRWSKTLHNSVNQGKHIQQKTHFITLQSLAAPKVINMTTSGAPSDDEVVFHKSDVIMSAMASQITGVSNCMLSRSFRYRSKKTSKLRVTGLCEWNPPLTGGFPSQRASNAENTSIWWRHHVRVCVCHLRHHGLI